MYSYLKLQLLFSVIQLNFHKYAHGVRLLVDCRLLQNAVGHNSADDKSEATFQWTPPADLTEDIRFV